MNYPDWSPESLINILKLRKDHNLNGNRVITFNPDDELEKMRNDEKFKHYSEEDFKQVHENFYRKSLGLPTEESDYLLAKLITDLRMKEVWNSLARRRTSDNDAIRFWMACEGAIQGWRGEPKITPKERIQILEDIQQLLADLQIKMHKLRDFDFYSINKMIDKESVNWLLETLDADLSEMDDDKKLDYASFCLAEVIPNFD